MTYGLHTWYGIFKTWRKLTCNKNQRQSILIEMITGEQIFIQSKVSISEFGTRAYKYPNLGDVWFSFDTIITAPRSPFCLPTQMKANEWRDARVPTRSWSSFHSFRTVLCCGKTAYKSSNVAKFFAVQIRIFEECYEPFSSKISYEYLY